MTRRILRLLSAVAAAVLVFLLLLLFTLPPSSPLAETLKYEIDLEMADWSYGVIVDAGSTGSRAFLYRWRSISEDSLIDIHPVSDHYGKPVVKKVTPGLSSFADTPSNATGYMKPLFDYVVDYVPDSKRTHTPVFIFATAGMRLLQTSAQEAILKNLRSNLPLVTPMHIVPENIKVIQGKWEGIYSWIAVNYILKRFDNNKSKTDRKPTVGMADMGGASVQIAFEVNEEEASRSDNYEEINLGCNDGDLFKYRLFVTTFLGYGVNEGLHKYEHQLGINVSENNGSSHSIVKDPCLPLNLIQKIGELIRKGLGDWDKCLFALSNLINTNANTECSQKACYLGKVIAPKRSLSTVELYGFSEYWFSLEDVLDLGGPYNFSVVAAKARKFCRQKWSTIRSQFTMNLYPNADENRLQTQCFKSAWIAAVLHSGFSVNQSFNRFQSVLNIDGQEVQWALGALLYQLRYFPLRDSQRNLLKGLHRGSRNSSSGSFFAIFLLFAVIVFVILRLRY